MTQLSPWLSCFVLISFLIQSLPATASIRASVDVTTDLGGNVVRPGDVIDDLSLEPPGTLDFGPLPDGADVIAFTRFGAGVAFTLGHVMQLPDDVVASPRDVVLYENGVYSLLISGALVGFPDGSRIDAFAINQAQNRVILSFAQTIMVGNVVFDDADVFDGSDVSLAFDSTAAGVADSADVDAVSFIPGSTDLLLSFERIGNSSCVLRLTSDNGCDVKRFPSGEPAGDLT